ncbi:MAG: MATE family efflux transporter [Eubacteriales bacterium]|nr:MATE family efflux transporter [Eubacteriales bacterium]
MTQQTNRKDELLEGAILPTLLKLSLPIMATGFVQMAYNLTDMAWIGLLGANSVAAVGAAGMFMWLAQGIMNIAKMGGQVTVGQSVGAGNMEEARGFLRTAMRIALVLALVYAAICLLFADRLIGFFQLNGEATAREAEVYLRITGGCILFSFFNQTLTGIYTSVGDARTPFLANCIGLFGNMLLDPVLIFGPGPVPGMGVAGAALATVSAQAVVCAVLFGMRKRSGAAVFTDNPLFRKTERWQYQRVLRIGLPASVQTTVYCFISMVLTRLVAGWGDAAIAVQRVGSQVESIGWMTGDGFAAAVNAFMAQNFGAGNKQRIRQGYRTSIVLMVIWGAISSIVLYFGAVPLVSLFLHDPEVIPAGADYLRILSYGEIPMCLEIMTVGALSGLGLTALSSVISMTLTGARIPIALALSASPLGLNGIWWAFVLSSIAKGVVFTCAFLLVLHRQNSQKG